MNRTNEISKKNQETRNREKQSLKHTYTIGSPNLAAGGTLRANTDADRHATNLEQSRTSVVSHISPNTCHRHSQAGDRAGARRLHRRERWRFRPGGTLPGGRSSRPPSACPAAPSAAPPDLMPTIFTRGAGPRGCPAAAGPDSARAGEPLCPPCSGAGSRAARPSSAAWGAAAPLAALGAAAASPMLAMSGSAGSAAAAPPPVGAAALAAPWPGNGYCAGAQAAHACWACTRCNAQGNAGMHSPACCQTVPSAPRMRRSCPTATSLSASASSGSGRVLAPRYMLSRGRQRRALARMWASMRSTMRQRSFSASVSRFCTAGAGASAAAA